jgi:glycosyltransferase involved in cell wall biosynthesis
MEATISICIATYGSSEWDALARERAYPSAASQDAHEVIMEHQPLGDVATSRNAAAESATGKWLCFLDADDELAPGYTLQMGRVAEQVNGERMLFTPRTAQVIKGRQRPPRYFPETTFQTGNWLVIGTLVERELFMKVGGFRPFPHGLEDWAFWSECVKAGATIKKVPSAIYIAHYNDDSAHHQLARDHSAYMSEYRRVQQAVWG